MFSKYLVPAVAVIGSVAAQSSQCTQSTATINTQAQATALAGACRTFTGDVLVSDEASGTIDLSGIGQLRGSLIVENAGRLTGLASSSLNSITERFLMTNLTGLSSLSFPSLNSVGTISWTAITALDSLSLGTPGVQKADTVIISDTFLQSLDGIDVTSLKVLDVNNNGRLTQWNSKLGNLSDTMNFLANGNGLELSFPDLKWIANMTISNVTSISLPSLQVINGSASFTSNQFLSLGCPNLTSTTSGSLNIISNNKLTNITFPQLTSLKGALLIANNTALQKIDDASFPKLKTVGGAVKVRGNFTEINFDALTDVRGAFDLSSTQDISEDCTKFEKQAPTKQKGNGNFQGVFHCESNNEQANSDTGGNTSTTGGTSGGSSGGKDDGNSAAGVAVNAAMLGLAVVGGLVALL
ncbi:hypothetical protein GE09DRAFT_1229411 [Coniochaeta sp. 2T2.1]|nr:hypothetical protein GE09DRAFT_1229411 [Coniochaeta sp. 2T2.1]